MSRKHAFLKYQMARRDMEQALYLHGILGSVKSMDRLLDAEFAFEDARANYLRVLQCRVCA